MHNLSNSNKFVDTHCHLQDIELDLPGIFELMEKNEVAQVVTVGVTIENSRKGLEIKHEYPDKVFAGLGIQPEVFIPGSDIFDAKYDEKTLVPILKELEKELENNDYDLIGECGLDYYWLERSGLTASEVKKSKLLQSLLFEALLLFSKINGLPISIHSRGAEKECYDMVKKAGLREVVFHSYTGPSDLALKIVEEGWSIGVNGIVTYKSGQNIREIITTLSEGKKIETIQDLAKAGIVLETDAPLLKPGNAYESDFKFNLPSNVVYIWKYIYSLLKN